MRKMVPLVLLIFSITILGAQEFREIESQLVTVFPFGNSESSLGYRKITDGTAVGVPSAFCFDLDGNLVVSDWINKRISCFDQNWQPIKTIDLTEIIYPTRMEVDAEGNFICYYGSVGIRKIDVEGNTLFFLHVGGEDIADDIRSDGFYIIDDLVLAYNDNNGGIIGFKDLTPDYKENNKKPILNTQQVIREIEQNHPTLMVETGIGPSIQQRNSTSRPIVPGRQSSEYVIYENGVGLSRDFDRFMTLKSQDGAVQSRTLGDGNQYSMLLDRLENALKIFIGTDLSGNHYWKMASGIFVFNSEGIPIAAFKFKSLKRRSTRPVISPQGDVYFMSSGEAGHYLYKIERDW